MVFQGLRRLKGRGASFSFEEFALGGPEPTMRVALAPRGKVAESRPGSERKLATHCPAELLAGY